VKVHKQAAEDADAKLQAAEQEMADALQAQHRECQIHISKLAAAEGELKRVESELQQVQDEYGVAVKSLAEERSKIDTLAKDRHQVHYHMKAVPSALLCGS
jgi:chromosome segregation ATPase